MFDISVTAGVGSRIATIRARINALTAGSGSANVSGEIRGPSSPTDGFDPFGSVYQLALENVAITPASQSGRLTSSGTAPTTLGAADGAPKGALAGQQIAQLAYNAGFRGQDLVSVVAISKRESNWKPSAFNGDASTNDLSYGLMQINMKGSLGTAHLREFGLSTNDQLFDPQTNMNAAFKIYSDSANTLNAWGGYKGVSDTFDTDLAAATKAVADAHLGSEP